MSIKAKSPKECGLTSVGSVLPIPFVVFIDGILLWDCFSEAEFCNDRRSTLRINGRWPAGYGLEHIRRDHTDVDVRISRLTNGNATTDHHFNADVVEFGVAGGQFSLLLGEKYSG